MLRQPLDIDPGPAANVEHVNTFADIEQRQGALLMGLQPLSSVEGIQELNERTGLRRLIDIRPHHFKIHVLHPLIPFTRGKPPNVIELSSAAGAASA